MSLNDIPGTVTFRRHWPLGLVVSMLAAILLFVFETRSSLADLERRAGKLEMKEEKRAEADTRMSTDLAVIRAHIETVREWMREDRRARGQP